MKHFVSYHNAEVMGYTFEEATAYSVVTRKHLDLKGQRIWSISGEGQPRSYFLRETWIVDDTGPSDQAGFSHYARGSSGFRFNPPVPLKQLSWFRAFRESQGNFGLGLNRIKDEFVGELEALLGSKHTEEK